MEKALKQRFFFALPGPIDMKWLRSKWTRADVKLFRGRGLISKGTNDSEVNEGEGVGVMRSHFLTALLENWGAEKMESGQTETI